MSRARYGVSVVMIWGKYIWNVVYEMSTIWARLQWLGSYDPEMLEISCALLLCVQNGYMLKGDLITLHWFPSRSANATGWSHFMKTLSTWPVHSDGNPLVTVGFPSQKASDHGLSNVSCVKDKRNETRAKGHRDDFFCPRLIPLARLFPHQLLMRTWWRHQMETISGDLRRHRAQYDVTVMRSLLAKCHQQQRGFTARVKRPTHRPITCWHWFAIVCFDLTLSKKQIL